LDGEMAKRQQKKRQRRSSGLREHRREKKILAPPFNQLPGLQQANWSRDDLPDFLWLAAIVAEMRDIAAAHEPLDILDELVPGGLDPLDGRLTRFEACSPELRSELRAALSARTEWALPDGLGHGLALYPEAPGAWLYEDWGREHHADPEAGLAYLKRLVAALFDPRGRESTAVRM
jgi:hypothetical protein